MPFALRISQTSFSSTLPRMKSEIRTGVSRKVRSSEPMSANTTVSAMGLNIFPSTPSRLRIGR